MKALVYHGPGQKAWEEVPDPKILAPTDAIVRIDTTTICGTDLHILKGDVPAVTDGRILGHEGVGTVAEVGSAVTTVSVGDRVIISCISACGACSYCHQGLYAHCLADEGASGHRLDPRPPDRRHPGRAGAGPLRRQLGLPRPRGGHRRGRRHALRHPPDRLRDRRALRPGQARRRRRRGRRRARGSGRDDDLRPVRRRPRHRPRPRRQPAGAGHAASGRPTSSRAATPTGPTRSWP